MKEVEDNMKNGGGDLKSHLLNWKSKKMLCMAAFSGVVFVVVLLYRIPKNTMMRPHLHPPPALRQFISQPTRDLGPCNCTTSGTHYTTFPPTDKLDPELPYSSSQAPINISLPTSYEFSQFYIKSKEPLQVCDRIEVRIEARDVTNKPKPVGGDYFWAWLNSADGSKSSVVADELVDHKNGTYTARFQLHWSGKMNVLVGLVHSSEAVYILRRNRHNFPARYNFEGKFYYNNATADTPCHITRDLNLPPISGRTLCDFTDDATGFPWFCVKPEGFPCYSYIAHALDGNATTETRSLMMNETEHELFAGLRYVSPQLLSSSMPSIFVNAKGEQSISKCTDVPDCRLGVAPHPRHHIAGFYYDDKWNSLICKNRIFRKTEIIKCFQSKTLHFLGDSTLRQWYEYFTELLPLTEFKGYDPKLGPHVAFNDILNVTLHYHHHGLPVRNHWTPVSDIQYIPNLIDDIADNTTDIILLSLWAHFTLTNLDFYRNRWEVIKKSILRLKARKPGTKIIIKSANTREFQYPDESNWYAWELDKLMRRIMRGVDDVTIIDVWDMTIGHRTGYNIHPSRGVVVEEIKMLLSFICPSSLGEVQ